ncbi:hypothetical protein MASR2M17_17250 [Aminivibrio sp.]
MSVVWAEAAAGLLPFAAAQQTQELIGEVIQAGRAENRERIFGLPGLRRRTPSGSGRGGELAHREGEVIEAPERARRSAGRLGGPPGLFRRWIPSPMQSSRRPSI